MIQTQISKKTALILCFCAILAVAGSIALWTKIVRSTISDADAVAAESIERPSQEQTLLMKIAKQINIKSSVFVSPRTADTVNVSYVAALSKERDDANFGNTTFSVTPTTRVHQISDTTTIPEASITEEEEEQEVPDAEPSKPAVADPGSWIGQVAEQTDKPVETEAPEEPIQPISEEVHESAPESDLLEQWKLTYAWNISIPAIGLNAPVLYPSLKYWKQQLWTMLEEQMQVGLDHGSVAYPHSVAPGNRGSLIIAGHSSPPTTHAATSGFGHLFASLPDVEVGDNIIIRAGGEEITYEIQQKMIVASTHTTILEQQNKESLLKLITCYPVGTTRERLVVIAKKV